MADVGWKVSETPSFKEMTGMKGVIGAKVIREQWGNYIIRIECIDRDTAEKIVKKMRIVGIFATFKETGERHGEETF